MFHADDYLTEQEEAPKRSRRRSRSAVHIHVLQDYEHMKRARNHAEFLEITYDCWSDSNVNILAVSGTLNEILQMQSFVDGMNSI